jgi:hypothetical protein
MKFAMATESSKPLRPNKTVSSENTTGEFFTTFEIEGKII